MKKCNHPPGNDFGSVAVTAAVLLRSPEARSYSPAAAQSFSATPEPCSHIHARLGESIRERIVVIGLAVIRPTVRPKLRANTRASNDCDGRASTRRESSRFRVLIVIVTATTRSVWG